tara:strand:- start:945 stop:1163 length:219 start_codon:yes stop_codon:yes gene_type:complete
MSVANQSNERIKRRELPEFEESESSIIESLLDDGIISVALDDTNQYGPHAMIIMLFGVASLTAVSLLLISLI